MATIQVDGNTYHVEEGLNLLQACLSLGFDVPHLCWHPALNSAGACRLCAVRQLEDENDTHGRIVMSCMTPATEGTRISVNDPEVRAYRAGVVEWLLKNHPHDCPVCDEGGECRLQEATLATGQIHRRYRFGKRTYRDQDLGPFLQHEMNRCIHCYQCVRFYRDYAGGRDLHVFGARDHIYLGRHQDGTPQSPFSGNLVEVCPTGAFTDAPLRRHFARSWDLRSAPSICVHCGLGCNTLPGEWLGTVRRVRNRYNPEVNGHFLCDRGRYGYQYVNGESRIHRISLRSRDVRLDSVGEGTEGDLRLVALEHAAGLLSGGARAIGIGSPRASLEANFLLRTLVGPENFHLGFSQQDFRTVSTAVRILREGPAPPASLRQVAEADAVLVLGEDVPNVAPMLALALRQTTRRRGVKAAEGLGIPPWHDLSGLDPLREGQGSLYIASVARTGLDEMAARCYRAAPPELARLGFAIAGMLGAETPPVEGGSDELLSLAGLIAEALDQAERPLVVAGTGCGDESVLWAAANVAWTLCEWGRAARLCFTMPECNSLGLGLMGGGSLEAAFQAAKEGRAEIVILLENDLNRRADAPAVGAFLHAAGHVIVIDHLASETTRRAELLLPASTFAEADGTLVNNEGRAQLFSRVLAPQGDVQESWRWLRDLLVATGRSEARSWDELSDVTRAMAEAMPSFRPLAAGTQDHPAMVAKESVALHAGAGRAKGPALPAEVVFDGAQDRALLRGGAREGKPPYFQEIPAPFEPPPGQWLIVPLYHTFGSEELSSQSPSIAGLIPQPYLTLNPGDAEELLLREGDEIELSVGGMPRLLVVRLEPSLPRRVAGLPFGLPGMLGMTLPIWSSFLDEQAASGENTVKDDSNVQPN